MPQGLQQVKQVAAYSLETTVVLLIVTLSWMCALDWICALSSSCLPRVSLSDGSESDISSPSPPSRKEAPPLLKTSNNQVRSYYVCFAV